MKILILFFISYALFFIHLQNKNNTFVQYYAPAKKSETLQGIALKAKPYFNKELNWAIANSWITGNTQEISKKTKEIYKELNLNHLFSPSGLHFTSLLFPLGPLYKIIPGLNFLVLFFLTPILFLPGLFSLRRSLIFLDLSFLNRNYFKFSSINVFIAVFIFDFMIGAFYGSLLSLIFSLLFWGIFVLEKKFIRRISYLALAQYMCICFFPAPFFPLSLPFNLIVSFIFTLIFPISLFNFVLPSHSIVFSTNEQFIEWFHLLICKIHQTIIQTPSIPASHLLLWFLILFLFIPQKRKMMIVIIVLFFSMPTDNRNDLRNSFELKLLKASSWKRG